MGRQIGLIVLGLFLVGVFLNVWIIPVSMLFVFALGMDGSLSYQVEYGISFALAVVTAVLIIRPMWAPKPNKPKAKNSSSTRNDDQKLEQ